MHEMQDHTGPSAGAQLRAAREMRELSIADVAYSLKLNPRQVDALEADRFDLLPGRAFARGFLKNYARFLELDPVPLLEAVDQASGAGALELSPVSNAQGTMPSADERFRPSVVPAALVALALMIVVAAGWYFDWFQQPSMVAEESLPAPLVAAPTAPAAPVVNAADGVPATAAAPVAPSVGGPADGSPPAEAPVVAAPNSPTAAPGLPPGGALPAAAPVVAVAAPSEPAAERASKPEARVGGQQSLVFRFGEDAWIEVRDQSGRVIVSRVGKGGTSEEVQGTPPFALVIGNAAKVVLEHDGRPVDLAPHTRVSVARLRLE